MKKDNKHTSTDGFKVPENYFENLGKKLMDQLETKKEKNDLLESTTASGFKTPDDYFKNFKKQLLNKLQVEKEEHTITKNKIESGFKTPQGYFDSFEEKLSKKIESQKSESKVISIFSKRNILYVSGIAAMIAVIISLSINKETSFNFEDIEIADIHTYFDEGNIELSNEEIANLLGDGISYTETLENEVISDQDLIDYISEEDLEDEIMFIE
ncbi:hypothetical protein U6A24_11635 [Aquimarina gracilis]|uniref:Uncharacterized protein n=1 Tax=Aquimarina gracilis TaxID=874422 RepID=A0ABU5ZW99_9FLAO|nr:hypothetical protein [Aquimarina gracilis]MEB3346117.1 hypothetical protein [Aquimarina gracilis]